MLLSLVSGGTEGCVLWFVGRVGDQGERASQASSRGPEEYGKCQQWLGFIYLFIWSKTVATNNNNTYGPIQEVKCLISLIQV